MKKWLLSFFVILSSVSYAQDTISTFEFSDIHVDTPSTFAESYKGLSCDTICTLQTIYVLQPYYYANGDSVYKDFLILKKYITQVNNGKVIETPFYIFLQESNDLQSRKYIRHENRDEVLSMLKTKNTISFDEHQFTFSYPDKYHVTKDGDVFNFRCLARNEYLIVTPTEIPNSQRW